MLNPSRGLVYAGVAALFAIITACSFSPNGDGSGDSRGLGEGGLTPAWARTVTAGPSWSSCNAVALDTAGCCYAAGRIKGTGSYDFGDGVVLSVMQLGSNPLLVKYDSDGTAEWARTQTQGSSYSFYYGVAVDGSGDVVAAGGMVGTANSVFGPGVEAAAPSTGMNPLIVKYSSSGTPLWARSFSQASGECAFTEVSVDSDGSIYAAGHTEGSASCTFGTGVTAQGPLGGENPLLVKYDPAGNALWARSVSSLQGGSAGQAECAFTAIAVDTSGNVLVAAAIDASGEFSFGNNVTVTVGPSGLAAVLLTYDASGNAQSVRTFATGPDVLIINSLAVDSSGSVYAAGEMRGTGTYDFGDGVTARGVTGSNGVVVMYDSDRVAQWALAPVAGTGGSAFTAISIGPSDTVYVAGTATGVDALDFGDGTEVRAGWEGSRCLILGISAQGSAEWAGSISSAVGDSEFDSVAADNEGGIVAGGEIFGTGPHVFGDSSSLAGVDGDMNLAVVKYTP